MKNLGMAQLLKYEVVNSGVQYPDKGLRLMPVAMTLEVFRQEDLWDLMPVTQTQ